MLSFTLEHIFSAIASLSTDADKPKLLQFGLLVGRCEPKGDSLSYTDFISLARTAGIEGLAHRMIADFHATQARF